MGRFRALVMMLSLVTVLFASPQPVLAAKPIIVGNGTVASCTEAALKNALLIAETIGGGTIQFKCGPAPVTIGLTGVTEIGGMLVLLIVPNNTTIDGGGLITLDGTYTATVLFVAASTRASLKRLTITNGLALERIGEFSSGGIANFGNLTISNSRVSGNRDCCGFGVLGVGAIWNTGVLEINNSMLSDNLGVANGGIANEGTLRIHNTIVADNGGTDHGGGVINLATLEITNSSFLRNFVGDGSGGAIRNLGTLTVKRSLFAENQAAIHGGGIVNQGTLNVDQSTFSHNVSGPFPGGGGIYSSGALTVADSTFSGNFGREGGGMLIEADSFASVRGSTFSENGASSGGGIFTAGSLDIRDSIITHNTAFLDGGGIYVDTSGTLTLKNTIVTENTPDDIFP
jgi:predicted outer membrane repeat protein